MLACLIAIAHFSNQTFAEQDLRPELVKHEHLLPDEPVDQSMSLRTYAGFWSSRSACG